MKVLTARHRPPSREMGSALLEALIAILLFSIGLLGIAGLQGKAAKMGVDAEDRATAALLADEMVAQMWLQKSPAVSPAWTARVAASSLAGAVGTVSAPDVNGNVTVTIQWAPATRSNGGGAKTAQFVTRANPTR